ncbi:hypothetical protein V8C42DRAFT_317396 [Trichoderma barbatum]
MNQKGKVLMHPTPGSAGRSCQSCKLKKRRCTRELPACSLCLRRRRKCLYPQVEEAEHQPSISSAEATILRHDTSVLRNSFPVAVFLDPLLSTHCGLTIPRPCVSLSPTVYEALGDHSYRKAIADEYFRTVHPWMPIISRTRLYGSLMDPSKYTVPDVAIVLLAMKLITSRPKDCSLFSELYTLMKETLLSVEMVGYVSICTVQSAILTVLYEIGHAIYPAALTTISACARHAIALGITQAHPIQGSRWIEQEERNRIWWAILMLDRTTNMPLNGNHLCTSDPDAASILPVDDADWDQGILSTDISRTLSSPPELKTGRFARLAEAINLLSQVLRRISNKENKRQLDPSDVIPLDRTLFALGRLIEIEEGQRNMIFCCSIAICYSALLLIHTVVLADSLKNSPGENQDTSYLSLQATLTKTLRNAQRFLNGEWGTVDDTSPFVLEWIYRSVTSLMSLGPRVEFCDINQGIITLREALIIVGERWRAASVYLRLIETRQAVGMR